MTNNKAPDEAARFTSQAEAVEDPVRRKKLLDEIAARYPDALAPQEALLHLGRLWQRDPKTIDYHRIKCYLLHVFDAPDEETPAMRDAMLKELTADPQLLRCLSMTDDPDGFIRRYADRLCRDYVKIFMMGSNRRSGRVFGFQFGHPEKLLALPAAAMYKRMLEARLPDSFACFPDALAQAFRTEVGDPAEFESACRRLTET